MSAKKQSSSEILQYIRRSLLLKLPYPVIVLILVFVIASFLPLGDAMFPLELETSPTTSQISKQVCVQKTFEKLYYTGYDYRRNGTIRGHYYYSLNNDQCSFFLIPSGDDPIAQSVLENYTVIGRLDSDAQLRSDLIRAVAEDISWTEAGLRRITTPYLINELIRFETSDLILTGILAVCALCCLISAIRMLVYLIRPSLSPAYRRLRHYGNPRFLMAAVEREMKQECILRTRDMCLTPGYLVEFSEDLSAIVPLKDVLWAYDHSTMHSFLGLWPHLTYTLHLVTMLGETYSFKHKRKEDVDRITNELSLRFPNFFIGYSEEHQKIVRHILKEEKKKHIYV